MPDTPSSSIFPFSTDLSLFAVARLSPETHRLADRARQGQVGRYMRPADFQLDAAAQLTSPDLQYAAAVRLIAERAPLNITPGEHLAGSATLSEARRHITPLLGVGSTSHTTPGFDQALKTGYRGLRVRVEARLQRNDLEARGRDFLQAMLICLEAAATWHERYMRTLDECITSRPADDPDAVVYRRVRQALANVPENPPANFAEAVQSLWFIFAFQRLCGNWPGLGRIDQMLGPYLQADLAANAITLDEARELLAHFWIKGCEWTDGTSNGSGDAQYYQNIILSGVDAEDVDVTNEVTYLVLDVIEELGISDFPVAVRVSRRTPERLWRRIAEVQRRGGGTVAIYNEDLVIRSMHQFGYPLGEARQFTNDGCWETLIPGKTNFLYWPFDILALLQQVLGVNQPEQPVADYPTFEALYQAFRQRLERQISDMHTAADRHALDGPPAPLISLLVEGCIENARGYHQRGPQYTVFAFHAGGLPDVANALLALRRVVYEEKRLTLPELAAVLRQDWAGQDVLRQWIRRHITFYGNGDAAADEMARRVFDDFTALVGQIPERNGVKRPAGLSTFGRQIEWAAQRGATAAGAHRGEYLSNNFSPTPGSEKNSLTGVIHSFCSVDFMKLPNGTALDIKIHPSSLQGEDGLAALVGVMKSFVELGGWFMHIDVVDSTVLREAQLHPDRYTDLAVRISGWSARFVTLSAEWQEMIIRRTEQEFR